MNCERCGYCERVTSQAISFDDGWRQEMISTLERAMETLTTAEIAGLIK